MSREEKKKVELEDFLYNNVETFSQITCSKCKTLETLVNVSDEWESVEKLIKLGWTKRGDKCLCPKCSVKTKKS